MVIPREVHMNYKWVTSISNWVVDARSDFLEIQNQVYFCTAAINKSNVKMF